MNTDQCSLPYHVYLLRLWQERQAAPERPAVWRFSVEDIRTRRRRGFTSLEELTTFLQTEIGGEMMNNHNTRRKG